METQHITRCLENRTFQTGGYNSFQSGLKPGFYSTCAGTLIDQIDITVLKI